YYISRRAELASRPPADASRALAASVGAGATELRRSLRSILRDDSNGQAIRRMLGQHEPSAAAGGRPGVGGFAALQTTAGWPTASVQIEVHLRSLRGLRAVSFGLAANESVAAVRERVAVPN